MRNLADTSLFGGLRVKHAKRCLICFSGCCTSGIFSSTVFQRKKVEVLSSLRCRRRCGGIVIVTNFNLEYILLSDEENPMKLHLLVHHHKGYNLTKSHNFARLF